MPMSTATVRRHLLLFLLFLLLSFYVAETCSWKDGSIGSWKMLKKNAGVSAMHMALLPNGKIIAFDRTTAGPSNLSMPMCRPHTNTGADCTVHAIEFDPILRSVRPLPLHSDTFCSSGTLTASGVLVQTGGFNDGDHAVRYFHPCDDGTCQWKEDDAGLAVRRWYASDQLLEDGETIIVVGGRRQFNYEFVPKRSASDAGVFRLHFLHENSHPILENNLYPFIHLAPDGNLFVFANTKAILLDYRRHVIVRTYPAIPGNFSRNYPSTGSSVLLPLVLTGDSTIHADVMVCGGTPPLSYFSANRSIFLPAADTCGRLRITDDSPQWAMEVMPMRRTMGDMVLLPNGDVLLVNGAGRGTAGWLMGRDPVLNPVLYRTGATYNITDEEIRDGNFEVLAPSRIPRMYHSSAVLLPDGTVLIGGSNPNVRYRFQGVPYVTELSMEAFYPPYLNMTGRYRPRIMWVDLGVEGRLAMTYGERVKVGFWSRSSLPSSEVKVTMVAPAFSTHSFTMNQRVLVLRTVNTRKVRGEMWEVVVEGPPMPAVAPPGYYMMFLVHGGLPSRAFWVRLLKQ